MLTLQQTEPGDMSTESEPPTSAELHLQPPVSVLLEAALRGLQTVPPKGEQPTRLERALEGVETLDPQALRRVAAERLLEGMELDLVEGTFYRKGKQLVRAEWPDLDNAEEHCNEAYVLLRDVVKRYVAAVGRYRGPEPKKLFPVEKNYRGWVSAYVKKSVWKSLEPNAVEQHLGDDDIQDACDDVDLTRSVRAFVRTMVQRAASGALQSPDLRAAMVGGRSSSKMRAKLVPSAAIQALNVVANDAITKYFTEPEKLASEVLTDQVEALIPKESQRQKFVSRHAADVLFAVAEALDGASMVPVGDQADEELAHYFASASQLWRASQLRAVVALLSDAMAGEIGGARVIAITGWVDDLEMWLLDKSTPDAVRSGAQRALEAAESASHGSVTSPLSRAAELLADLSATGAMRQAAEVLVAFVAVLRRFVAHREAS